MTEIHHITKRKPAFSICWMLAQIQENGEKEFTSTQEIREYISTKNVIHYKSLASYLKKILKNIFPFQQKYILSRIKKISILRVDWEKYIQKKKNLIFLIIAIILHLICYDIDENYESYENTKF